MKEGYTKHEDDKKMEQAQAVEYPKQPPLVEAMKVWDCVEVRSQKWE